MSTTRDGATRLDAAYAAMDSGNLDSARILAAQAVDLLAAQGDPDDPEVAGATLVLATALERAGRHAEAWRAAAAAASGLDHYTGAQRHEVSILRVQAHVAAGNLDRVLGDAEGARLRLRRAADIAVLELGRGHRETARAYTALGLAEQACGHFRKAETAFRRALAGHRARADRVGMATVLHHLGALEQERGEADAGIGWAERGLELREALHGPDHPDVAVDLGGLGALYLAAERFDDAEGAYLRALVILESTVGPEHHEVSTICGNFGLLLAMQGKTRSAEKLYRRALRGKAAALGEDHPELAVPLHNLGVLLAGTGRRTEALTVLRRAETLLAAHLPAGHPRLAAIRATLESS